MSFTHTVQVNHDRGNISVNARLEHSGGGELNIDETVPTPSTDMLVAATVDVSQIVSAMIMADQDITLYTNDLGTGAPDDTFVLAANNPLVWNNASPTANPFSADITALYVTNASGTETTLQALFLTDPTV